MFSGAFDAAVRDELLGVEDVLELGALPDDLLIQVMDGALGMDEVPALLDARRSSAPTALRKGETDRKLTRPSTVLARQGGPDGE